MVKLVVGTSQVKEIKDVDDEPNLDEIPEHKAKLDSLHFED